jgi:LmbE family N-acetylglucosaminyl deacetylase
MMTPAGPGGRIPASVLLISPHLDDAVMSAGATIAALAAGGSQVVVCTVFAGKPQPPFSDVAADFHSRCGLGPDPVGVRRQEDFAALTVLGAKAIHLDFLDAIYRRSSAGWLCRHPLAMFGRGLPPETTLTADIIREVGLLIQNLNPAQVWTCAAIGQHVDHRITRQAVTAAAIGHPLLLWEDLPYGLGRPPPHPSVIGSPPGTGAGHLQVKLDAIGCYESQVRMEWPGTDWQQLVTGQATARHHALGAYELLWPPGSGTA